MLYAAFGAILGAALLAEEEEYGYGESSNLWNKGGFGLRGAPRNWRDSDPRFGSSSQGMRGPTASFRYPLPRPWERAPVGWKTAVPVETGRYGEMVFEERNIVSVSPGDYGLAQGCGDVRFVCARQCGADDYAFVLCGCWCDMA